MVLGSPGLFLVVPLKHKWTELSQTEWVGSGVLIHLSKLNLGKLLKCCKQIHNVQSSVFPSAGLKRLRKASWMSQVNTTNRDLIMELISIGKISFCSSVSADITYMSHCAETKRELCNIFTYQLHLSSHLRDILFQLQASIRTFC